MGDVPDPNNPNRTIRGERWDYMRPGDFAASTGHVVYARADAVVNPDGSPQQLDTIEADYETLNGERGRVRERTRDGTFLEDYVPRRWLRR